MQSMRMKYGAGILAILIAAVLITSVSAELFSPINQRYIKTGQNSEWFYIQIHKVTGNDYIGFSKIDKGYIGIAKDDEYIGRMFFVPAFQHPVSHKWYVCPLIDAGSYSVDMGENYMSASGSGTYTCYEYLDTSQNAPAGMTVHEFKLIVDSNANVKITANVTVNSAVVPEDTGFAFIFVPTDQSKFRYAMVGSALEDITGSDRALSVDKYVEFFDSSQNYIGHRFYWNDMPEANNIMKIVTLGSKKGLLMGTYGYGAGRNIYVDPVFQVDYSPTPASWLINGSIDSDSDSAFTQSLNVSDGLSDYNDTTTYDTGRFGAEIESPDTGMVLLVHMNNDSDYGEHDNHVYDFSGTGNNGTAIDNAYPIDNGKFNGAFYFDGVDGYLNFGNDNSLDFGTSDFTVAFWVKTTETRSRNIVSKLDDYIFGANGWKIRIQNGNLVVAMQDGSPHNLGAGSATINDGCWHHVAVVFDRSDNATYYVDGEVDNQPDISGIGSVSNSVALRIAIRKALMNDLFFNGTIDDLAVWNRTLTLNEIYSHYNNNVLNKTITGSWNHTYDPFYNWWVRLNKITPCPETFIVYAYSDVDSINTSELVQKTLTGTGWFNINVSALMDYETNDVGLNYTKLRVHSEFESNISEMMLRKEVNDTFPPIFSSCQVSNTVLAPYQTALFRCNVTDDVDVEKVNGTIGGVTYNFTKDGDWYYYNWVCLENNLSVNWSLVEAEDIVMNYNSTIPDINISCYFTEDTANLSLSLYYEPYAQVGNQYTIHAIIRNSTDDNYPNATVTIFLDNSSAAMVWNETTQSYVVYWIPSAIGDYNFTVWAASSFFLIEDGLIHVADPYQICISLWNSINMTSGSEYINQFAWIYAVMPIGDTKQKLTHLFTDFDYTGCSPQSPDKCHWHGEYINGTACIDLYEIGNHSFYIIGNNIRFEQDIGSGFIQDCEFCPPVEIQQRLLLPLGNYYLTEDENIDIYVSENELYYRGLFYGALSSWLYLGIMFIVAFVGFVGTLWLTKSLKSAIAMLVLLPTIIWMLTSFTL